MGAFLQGLLGSLGNQAQESHRQKFVWGHQTNEEMAQRLEDMAKSARPGFAPVLLEAAYKYRNLAPGKKPGKDLDLYNILYSGVQQAHAEDQAAAQQEAARNTQQPVPAPPQGGYRNVPPPPPPPPSPYTDKGPQGPLTPDQMAQAKAAFPGASNPTVTSGPASNPGPPLPHLPPEWSGPVVPNSPNGVQALPTPPQFTDKPGMPGGGNKALGSAVPPTNPPGAGFNLPTGSSLTPPPTANPEEGLVVLPDGTVARSNTLLPEEIANRDLGIKMKAARAGAGLEREVIQQRINDLKATGAWDELTPRQQAELVIGAKQVTPELKPLGIAGQILGSQIPPGSVDVTGQPIDPNGYYRAHPTVNGGIQWVPNAPQTFESTVVDPNSPTGVSRVVASKNGAEEQARQRGLLPPSAVLPTSSTSSNTHGVVVDFGDHKEVVPVSSSTTTTRQRVLPGVTPGTTPPFNPSAPPPPPPPLPSGKKGGARAAASAALDSIYQRPGGVATPPFAPSTQEAQRGIRGAIGRVIGEKALPPFQRMTAEEKVGAIDNTLDIAHRVKNSLPMLNSLIAAGKIQMQLDPKAGIIKSFINRNMKLTPEEARLAGDFKSLMEHINTLRGPLGATGFRGAEAWAALQSQRGELLGRPDITSQVLDNTIQALDTQHNAFARALQAGRAPGRGLPPLPGRESEAPTGGKVKMRAPNGQVQEVDASQVDHYKSLGATVVK